MISNLPSLTALRAFEAAGILGSFKLAADKLYVSPTAVSHQIKKLEDELNCTLFERQTRKIVLTKEGEMLLKAVRSGFEQISDMVSQVRNDHSTQVSLAVGAIIASRWLTPKLSEFWGTNPDIDLSLYHNGRAIDFSEMNVDLAIAWGDGNWKDCVMTKLFGIEVSPVISPELLEKYGEINTPQDLLKLPLIHLRDGTDWRSWFEAAGVKDLGTPTGIAIEDANVALRTCMDGQGVALGILDFIQDDLAAGRLIQPFEKVVMPAREYYLLSRKSLRRNSPQWKVAEWIKSIC